MKNLKKLQNRTEHKIVTVEGKRIEFFRFDGSDILNKDSLVSVTIESEYIQVSVRHKDSLPSFVDCIKVKEFLFDDDEAVFLILKNLRILDNHNVDVRMFYSTDINIQAQKMDFLKALENVIIIHSEKRPIFKVMKQINGQKVHIISKKGQFPSLEEVEEIFKFKLQIPLICIKNKETTLNPEHMMFICDGDKMKLPKFVDKVGRIIR